MLSLFQDGTKLGRAADYFIAVSINPLHNERTNDKGHVDHDQLEADCAANFKTTQKTQLNHNQQITMKEKYEHHYVEGIRVNLSLNASGLFGAPPKPKPMTLAEQVAADVAARLEARGVFDALATETNNRAKK